MDREEARRLVDSVPHWHHRFEIFDGVVTPGSYEPAILLERLQLPEDLSGKRVLDLGPSDGYFSMQLAQRGALVTAVDYRPKEGHGFAVMERITGLEFTYHHRNIYDLSRNELGGFDIVLFLGLLYHLPDMMRALDILRRLCDGLLFVETEFEADLMPDMPVARYYEAATLSNDHTNFWAPNQECVLAMLRDANFVPRRHEAWRERRLLVDSEVKPHGYSEKMRLAYGVL